METSFEDIESVATHMAANMPTQAVKHSEEPKSKAVAKSESRADFFSLPAELRNYIYELALDCPKSRVVQYARVDDDFAATPDLSLPGVLQASKQFRAEAAPIYFGSTAFQVHIGLRDDFEGRSTARQWLKAIGTEQAGKIKALTVKFERLDPIEVDQIVTAFAERYRPRLLLVDPFARPKLCRSRVMKAYELGGLGLEEEVIEVKWFCLDTLEFVDFELEE